MAGSSKSSKDDKNKDDATDDTSSPEDVTTDETPDQQEIQSADEDVAGIEDEPAEASDETPDPEPTRDETESDVPGVIPAYVEARPEQTAAPAPTGSGPSMLALITGGAIAGAVGFLIAMFAVPGRPPEPTPVVPDLSADLAAQDERLNALLSEFEAFRDAPVAAETGGAELDLTPFTQRQDETDSAVAEVGEVLGTIQESLANIDTRLTAIEEEPRTVIPDGSAAMEAQLEAFRGELDAVTEAAKKDIEAAQARASEIEAAAAERAEKADRGAALAELSAALESGAPYQDIIDRLPDAPAALTGSAENGVVPLAVLQREFPAAARTTLQSAESAPADDAPTSRFAAFLRKQTNARSLAPREGDDVDAVLSRSEAALNDGNLSAALEELSSLGGTVSDEMNDWLSKARERADAVQAAETLASGAN